MWSTEVDSVAGGLRLRFVEGGTSLSFRELFERLDTDDEFAAWYTRVLADCEYSAYFWEHPPLSPPRFDEPSELVLIDAPLLSELAADPEPFESRFERDPGPGVISFPNLGGDATLIVPRPIAAVEAYAHLAAFVRNGPSDQVRDLWRCAANAVRESVGPKPTWLSTAGFGVSWLHLRLDTRPKYYRHLPYTRAE